MKYLLPVLFLFSGTSFAAEYMKELTDATFNRAVNNSPLAVVTFQSWSCSASAHQRDVLADFHADNPSVDIFLVDSPSEPVLSDDFAVRVYPTTYVFRYGKRIFGFSGVGSESFIVNKINSHR